MPKIIAMEEKVRIVLDYYIELLEKFLGNVEEMKHIFVSIILAWILGYVTGRFIE